MIPRTTFPGSGPDQTLFFILFAVGFALALLGHLTTLRALRLVGIVVIFVATAILLGDVLGASSG